MAKRLLIATLIFAIVITASLCLVSCNGISHDHKSGYQLGSNLEQHWDICAICYEPFNAEDHEWDVGVLTTAPTYTTKGTTTYTCVKCGKQKVELVPVVEHDHRYQDSWYKNSESHWQECTLCHVQQDKTNHSLDKGNVCIAATVSNAGLITYTCTVCGYEREEEIAMLPHEHDYMTIYGSDNDEHWHECSICSEKRDIQAHNWDNGTIIQAATTTETGVKQYSCSICDRKKTEEIPVLPSSNQLLYKLIENNSFYEVVGFDGLARDIVIPESYNGLRVKTIGQSAFEGNANLKSIVIPTSVTEIQSFAFYQCVNLEKVVISESVNWIGKSAFAGCSALTEVTFAKDINAVKTSPMVIQEKAFARCVSLPKIELAKNTAILNSRAFEDCYSLASIEFNEILRTIGSYAFANCTKLNNIEFPESLENIHDYAFEGCTSLQSIILLDSVQLLGMGVFRNDTALESFTFTNSVDIIPSITFQNCTSLVEVDIPKTVNFIGDSAFSGCTAIRTLKFNGNIYSIGNSAFYNCLSLEDIYYYSSAKFTMGNEHYNFFNAGIQGDGITLHIGAHAYIPDGMFEPIHDKNYPNITALSIEDGATKLDYFKTYSFLPNLVSISVPQTLVSIEDGVFTNTNPSIEQKDGVTYLKITNGDPYFAVLRVEDNVESVSVEEGVRIIADYAFVNKYYLENLTLPDSLIRINYGAFNGCYSLSSLTLPFVGGYKDTTLGYSSDYEFGHIFGETMYDYGVAVNQTYKTYCIPESLQDLRVNACDIPDYAFAGCSNLTSINLTNNLKTIGKYAFRNCTNLPEIDLPNSVTKIEDYAFQGCKSLTSLEVPSSVLEIGEGALSGCISLERLVIPFIGNKVFEIPSENENPEELGDGENENQDGNTEDEYQEDYNDDEYQENYFKEYSTDFTNFGIIFGTSNFYDYCSATTQPYLVFDILGNCAVAKKTYYIPNSLATVVVNGDNYVPDGAFYNCNNLVNVIFNGNVVEYGDNTFYNCTSLVSVSTEGDLQYIGNNCFYNCASLTEITIPETVTDLGSSAFENCVNLQSVVFNANVTEIPAKTFYGCTSLETIDICETVNFISTSAFELCASLTNIDLSIVTNISSRAFAYCTSLQNVVLPNSLTTISDNLFYGCTSIETIQIPESIVQIEESAFENCSSLTSIAITNVQSIGEKAFFNCIALQDVTLSSDLTTISSLAFGICEALDCINLPQSLLEIGNKAFSGCSALTTVVVPNSVTKIGAQAFEKCAALETLSIPFVGLQDSEDEASSVRLFGAIFGTTGFDGSLAITQFYDYYTSSTRRTYYIPSSLTKVIVTNCTTIGYGAFSNCNNLTSIELRCNISQIYDDAFYSCSSLQYVLLPSTVTTINNYAFNYCKGLERVYYMGDEETFANISVGSTNAAFTSAQVWYMKNCVHTQGEWRFDEDGNISTESDIGETVIDKPATCTELGEMHGTCKICGEEFASTIPMIPHTLEQTTEEATCTTNGLITRVCSVCGYSESETIPALGHTYKGGDTCTVCGYIKPYTITNDSSYPFTVSDDGTSITSTNKSHSSSSSYTITANTTLEVSFEYCVSSEYNYDYFKIKVNGVQMYSMSGTGNSYKSASLTLYAGDVLEFTYSKDGSSSEGSDCGYIRNLTIIESNIAGE